jgi:aryl-alcohol dehydrogenase-like predicted oxidoreductase
MHMQKRKLGNSNIAIAPLALGGNVFDWTADEKTSHAVLDAFVGAGFNCVDTANAYSTWVSGHKGGESETVIGNWLKKRGGRDKVVIATKIGAPMGDGGKGLSKDYVAKEVEASLKRLQTDYIDLYQSHYDDEATPIEETLRAFAKLIEQGKVRAIGASNFSVPRLAESLETSKRLGLPRYESLQPLYNLYDRKDYEDEREALCVKENIGVIPYYALAAGFLTGKYRSEADLGKSERGNRSVKAKYLNERGLRILKALDEVAARANAKSSQIAIAWLMTRPGITAPIASATSVAQVEELIAATRITLDGDALKRLNAASA